MAAARTPGLRVLVVDDQPSVGDSLRRILALSGHRAEIVPRADEALRLFEPGKLDLVIADYAMPGMKVTRWWPRSARAPPLSGSSS